MTKLYVTKSAFAAFLILTIGTSSEAYPLLPRHLSLAASLTIGIPSFFLALAPSSGPWRAEQFVRDVARFAVPAGALIGTGLVGRLPVRAARSRPVRRRRPHRRAHDAGRSTGLYLVIALEAGGSRRRSTLVAVMCAVMAGLYVAALATAPVRTFFALTVPNLSMILTALAASAIAIGALHLGGFSLRLEAPRRGDGG